MSKLQADLLDIIGSFVSGTTTPLVVTSGTNKISSKWNVYDT